MVSQPERERLSGEDKFEIGREVRLVPSWVVGLAGVLFVAVPVCFMVYVWPREKNPPPVPVLVLISFLPGMVLAFLALMVGYVNRDAKRRGMNSVGWTLIALFVPNAIGFIIYFLVRHPLMVRCPQCGESAQRGFNYCPKCSFNLNPTCPQCKRAIRVGDTFCPYCGARLAAAS